MTWKQFKDHVESQGVENKDPVIIDIDNETCNAKHIMIDRYMAAKDIVFIECHN